MQKRILSLLLSLSLLLQQIPALAFTPQGTFPARNSRPAEGVDLPAKTDYLGHTFSAPQWQKASEPAYKASNLQARLEQALKTGDAAQFYLLLTELNSLLISQLSDSFLPNRINALQLLASHIKEGFISAQEQKEVAVRLEKNLRYATKCEGQSCQFLGLAALTLALCAQAPLPDAVATLKELPLQSNRQRVLALYSSLLARDYGSEQSNQIVGEYILRANAWLGGIAAAKQQIDQLVHQANAGGYTYDVKNYKLQRFAVELLSAFGPSSIEVLKTLAAHSESLTVRTHAAIELAYKNLNFQDMQQVRQQLEYIYCNIKLRLPHQLDFELRQQIGYAYGQGRKPQHLTANPHQCVVVVPTAPNPHLILDEWVLKAGKEAVLWFAPGGIFKAAQVGWKTLRHLKTLRLYVNTHHGMSLRQFYQSGRRLPIMGFKANLYSSIRTAQKAEKISSGATPVSSELLRARTAASIEPEVHKIRNMFLDQTNDLLASTRARTDLTVAQRAHVERLAKRVEENPTSSYVLGEVKRELEKMPKQQSNALVVFGTRMEDVSREIMEESSRNFMTDGIGWKLQNAHTNIGTNKPYLRYHFQQYGPTTDDLLLRWETHGGLDQLSHWTGELNDVSSISMPELIKMITKNLEGASKKAITLWIDSCYPGAAFRDFMSLPYEMRKNFNLFALGGHMQLNFTGFFPKWLQQSKQTPLSYALLMWKYGGRPNTITGKAFVNGQVIDPLAQAIKNSHYFRPTVSRELQMLKEISEADNSYSLYQSMQQFVDKVPGASVKNLQWPTDYYVIPYNRNVSLDLTNQVLVPERLVEEVKSEITKIKF